MSIDLVSEVGDIKYLWKKWTFVGILHLVWNQVEVGRTVLEIKSRRDRV